MIVAAVLASAAKTDSEDAAEQEAAEERLEEYQELKAQQQADLKEMERLRQLMIQADKLRQELQQKKAELARLKEEQAAQLKVKEELAELLAKLQVTKERIQELEKSLAEVEAEIAKLLEELKKRKIPPPPAKVQIRPSGSGTDLKPTFIECTARGLVLYEGQQPFRIAQGDIWGNQKFNQLLQQIGDSKNRSLVFLVRDDGLGPFRTASRKAKAERVRHGKLPVPGQGELDLTLFEAFN